MIKQLWFVRNEHRLFNYLNFAIAGFTLIYTILNIIVFEGANTRYAFLILPIIALSICILLNRIYKGVHKRKSILSLEKEKQIAKTKICQETAIGYNFILMLLSFFIQMDILNTYKNVGGSYIILEILCIVAFFCFGLYQKRRLKNIKK